MIVISDTTPLNYLILVNAVDVLEKLFTTVYIPPSVVVELTRLESPDLVRKWALDSHSWLIVRSPSRRLPSTAKLGAGEADAISLAKQMQIRDVLMDERRGRNVAQREGLMALPTIAILERAAEAGFLQLEPALTRLGRTNIRVPAELMQAARNRDAARKRAAAGGNPTPL